MVVEFADRLLNGGEVAMKSSSKQIIEHHLVTSYIQNLAGGDFAQIKTTQRSGDVHVNTVDHTSQSRSPAQKKTRAVVNAVARGVFGLFRRKHT